MNKHESEAVLPDRESDEIFELMNPKFPPLITEEIQYLTSLSFSFPICKMAVNIFSSRHEGTTGIASNQYSLNIYLLLVRKKRNWFFTDKNKLLTIFFIFKIRVFLPKLFGIAFHFAAFCITYNYVGYCQPLRISLAS